MPSYRRKKMCKECPFRASAPSGWLGPWTIDEIEQIVQFDVNLICHVAVANKQKRGLSNHEIGETGQHCVGMLRYMNSMCKLSRDPDKMNAQQKVRTVDDIPVIAPNGFRNHHMKLGVVSGDLFK